MEIHVSRIAYPSMVIKSVVYLAKWKWANENEIWNHWLFSESQKNFSD